VAGGGGCGTVLLVILFLVVSMFLKPNANGGDPGDTDSYPTQDAGYQQPVEPTRTSKPFTPPPASTSGDTWLVMLYQDADDKILEQDIYVDLNEAERVGSTDQVRIVTQIDRFRGAYQGDGNWSGTRRYYVTKDNDLQTVNSQLIQDLGEVNMSSGQTLVDFATWAIQTFPADKYVLILSDHGMGWPGGWSDTDSRTGSGSNIPLASRLDDNLYLMEIDDVLGKIRSQTGIDKFEIVGMDACLMGQIEVFTALTPHARYAVASEEVEPALGWAYASFLGDLTRNPGMSGAELSGLIVSSYINEDERIVDPNERASMLSRGSPFGSFSLPGAEAVAQQMGSSSTLTALDLGQIPALLSSLNEMALSLQSTNQQAVASARSYAQSYTSIFGNDVPPSYVDLGHFAALVKRQTGDGNVAAAVDDLNAAIKKAVIAEKHGAKRPGSTGIAIYFPNSDLYRSAITGAQSYTAIANRFASQSLWDDFLAFHYTGNTFDERSATVAVPADSTAVRGPGAGQIQVSAIRASSSSAAPGEPVTLSLDLSGTNIGYIYLFVGYYDANSNSINVLDIDYLQSTDTQEINGVYYPVWGATEFTLEFDWDPIVFAINDGLQSIVALFQPQTYGASQENAVYTVEGQYTFANGDAPVNARLYFSDNELKQVYGLSGDASAGAPREIIPQAGDAFTVYNRWLEMGSDGQIAKIVSEPGQTITFGTQIPQWESLYAAAGDYVIGFIVEDLDGNRYPVYTQLTVK
jgi:hypothetical protein